MEWGFPAGGGPVSPAQLIDPDGRRTDEGELAASVADVDAGLLRGRYRDMVLTRRFDDEATALQRQGELGLWASMAGQEAAQVGSARALRPQDVAFPTYREHAAAWVRGIDLADILSLYRCVDFGGWALDGRNFASYNLVIAAQTLHATGYALGVQRDGLVGTGEPHRDTAVLVYLGDGATSEGDANESLVFAASFQAPLVMFVQNNQWAISVPATRQSRVPLAQRGTGFGVPGVQVDGNDVLAVEAVTRLALERARSGGGPTLVEAFTYRMRAHTTSDDTTRYREVDEEESWRARDPLLRVRRYLESCEALDAAWLDALRVEADDLGADVRRRCRELPEPDPVTMFDHVYGAPHGPLQRERAEFEAYRSGTPAPQDTAPASGAAR